MSEQDTGQERSEEPTPKRRQDFRKQGKTANSRELTSVGVLAAASFGIAGAWNNTVRETSAFAKELLGNAVVHPELFLGDTPLPLLLDTMGRAMLLAAPPVLAAAAAGLLLSLGQVGFHISGEPLKPDIKHFNPITGLKNKLASAQAVAEWVKAMVKVLVIGGVAWHIVASRFPDLVEMAQLPLADSLSWTAGTMARLAAIVLLVMGLPAVADVAWSRHQLLKQMRMTREELKKEHKEDSGDPHVKARVRRIMLEMSRNRMVVAVSEATVIVTNPSHYSVALKYELGCGAPPIVVARGIDAKARKIKEIARSKGIPRVENRVLARALYASCREGSVVPTHLFDAVSEVLAFVFSLRRRGRGAAPHR
jgi:flagellar biosynthetic protein FlhB